MATGAMLGSHTSETSRAVVPSSRVSWQRFQPAGENFSAEVPSDGKQIRNSVPFGDQMIDVNYYMAHDGQAVYALMWTTGPFQGETDNAAIDATLSGLLKGVGAGYGSIGGKFSCEPHSNSDISMAGYAGREFDLRSCTIPAMSRAYTKVIGSQRQVYLGAVFYFGEDPNVTKFLGSFTVKSQSSKTRSSSKTSR